ncbi:MAG: hypothetical protein HN368_10635 [Spirochaetales bacterium]|jgi:CRISPR/Cas system-associated exonuclease Cas4 (RecB family)|nr:hypothetical protein [Spirochaetales bacterium]
MNGAIDLILEQLPDEDTLFIYPSEIAASFWSRKVLSGGGPLRALRPDRFISWDTYKEKTFDLTQEAVPANRLIKLLFTADLLRSNAEGEPFLKKLLIPGLSSSWRPFVRSISRALPALGALWLETELLARIDTDLLADLQEIYRHYSEFLDSHGLYEPGWQVPSETDIESHGVVFFPQVIQDYEDFGQFLAKTGLIEFDGLVRGMRSGARSGVDDVPAQNLRAFPNAKMEVESACLEILKLLETGIPAADIAVSLTSSEGYTEELQDTAALYDIPLLSRLGKPLAEYPAVRLYYLLAEVLSGGFSVYKLKELFLNTAYPWKNPAVGRGLVRFGIENFGLQNHKDSKGFRDLWDAALKKRGTPAQLDYYRSFRRAAVKILQAATFSRLRQAVLQFNRQFLNTDSFTTAWLLPFTAALDELPSLQEASGLVPDLKIESPYSLWLMSLAERVYVTPAKGAGVSVFEYRVAAGIYPDHHFILGVSQTASSVSRRKFSFLPVTEIAASDGFENNLTDAFLRLYEHSGENVHLSYSREGFDGPHLAPEYYVAKVEKSDLLIFEGSPYRKERKYWLGLGSLPEALHTVQRSGLSYASKAGLAAKGNDFTSAPISSADLREEIWLRQRRESGEFRISPTSLDVWSGCGFSYFLNYVLKLEETDFDTTYSSPRITGIILHRVLAALTQVLDRELAGRLQENFERAKIILEEEIDRVFAEWRDPVFIHPAWTDERRHISEYLAGFLETESKVWDSARLIAVEESLEIPDFISGIVLHGRIDRISEFNGEQIIVDYKKRLKSKKSGMVSPENELRSFQVPCYLLLTEDVHGAADQALYYDVTEQKYHQVFGGNKPWFDPTEREDLLSQTRNAVKSMGDTIQAGSFITPKPRGSCDGCAFRGVCREKYVIR